ncbi:uncharacterized protein LOC18429790 isoform X6 [Amborella trichopoda]|uniref:uncharacterized protein LOC18429790 isoform X6 n=1 Tax=Amborella trichopoda TaxID=13333 RepID=UPI0009C077EC|nr:uncharacterized protein LOC18429790 isoform X6 [Amborella trichopoda]|eukprot:XP_020520293.1 uncharacterized protein LOC18429790 isoform X6 [Amborella trichopoda]
MAAGEAPKHLLSLLRDFASEKSQGERRVAGLKKRISELQPELESANLQLEDVKRRKEAAEHHVRGLEVELACAEALLQARQARLSSQQDAMSSIRAEFEALKKGEDLARKYFEIHRESHRPAVLRGDSEVSSTEVGNGIAVCNDSMNTSVDIQHLTKSHENALTCLMDEISIKQGAYQEDQAVQKKILQELAQQEKRILLIEAVAKESEELQAVSMQTAELEKVYTSLGDKLQTKFRCPRCNLDNIGQLGETFGGA